MDTFLTILFILILIIIGCFVLLIIAGFVIAIRNAFYENKGNTARISAAEKEIENQPEKTKPAWDLARATLESYFNRNLSQITSIFYLSVIVMLIGFGVLVWGLFQAAQSPNALTPAAITIGAGVLTEFIGATFLFVYRSTITQAMDYSKTLERINSVGMAMQILDTIPDEPTEGDLKSLTKAEIVKVIIQQASQVSDKEKGKSLVKDKVLKESHEEINS